MKYTRLTIVHPNGECRVAYTKFNSEEAKQKAIARLAELEDLIEDGWLIKLPCKVGDKFYVVCECAQEYDECDNCGCIFTCSCGDFEWQERGLYGEAAVRCPDCNKEIRFVPSRYFANKEVEK